MAVDYDHRLLITGPHATVRLFRLQLQRRVRLSVAGNKLWRETIPFSFKRLYELAPAAARVEPDGPYEPFNVCAWPIRGLAGGLAEVRYRLHTRNVEFFPFLRALPRKFPALVFRLVTFCLDANEIASYRIIGGDVRRWILPEARHDVHWEHARQEFSVAGDDVYEDDDARYSAEERMLEEALEHWEPASSRPARRPRYMRSWWGRPVANDLNIEQEIMCIALSKQRDASESSATADQPRKRRRR